MSIGNVLEATECSSVEIYNNLSRDELLAFALLHQEGVLVSTGAFSVTTPNRITSDDYFIVKDGMSETQIAWEGHQTVEKDEFNELWEQVEDYLNQHDRFVQHLAVEMDRAYSVSMQIICEFAWHALFCEILFARQHFEDRIRKASWTLMDAPSFGDKAMVVISFNQKRILLCGIHCASAIRHAIFSVLSFLLPQEDILPLEKTAVNRGPKGDIALFLELSGSSKSKLVLDSDRLLLGDGIFGWDKTGLFHLENGYYTHGWHFSEEKDSVVWNAIRQGSILENVFIDPVSRTPHFSEIKLNQSARVIYPREHIQKIDQNNKGYTPNAVILLYCDLDGVLPLVAKLTNWQAVHYFLQQFPLDVLNSDAVFLRNLTVYADLLVKRLEENPCPVFLVNTGWFGGASNEGGQQFSMDILQAVIYDILNREFDEDNSELFPEFNFLIPKMLTSVDASLLNPKNSWRSLESYQYKANILMEKINDSLKNFRISRSTFENSSKESN